MNNQAGRSDEQRVKEVYPDAQISTYDVAGKYWYRVIRLSQLSADSYDNQAEAWADVLSRLPKAEAAPEAVKIDWQAVYSGEKARDANMEVARLACKRCGGLQEGCTCPDAPPVEGGEVTSQKDDPICQLPSCGHPLSMHDDGEGGCTAPSDFSEKDYGGDVGVQPSPCICSRFRPVSAEGEDPRNGFAVEIALCRGGEAVKTLGTPEEVRFIIGEALDRHGIEEEIDYTLTVSRAQIPISSANASSPVVDDLEMELRQFMWLGHGHTGQYGDDGEMQCVQCAPFGMCDYKREPLSKVRETFRAVQLSRIASPVVAGGESEVQPLFDNEKHLIGALLDRIDMAPNDDPLPYIREYVERLRGRQLIKDVRGKG